MKKRILSFLRMVGVISPFQARLPSSARAHCSAHAPPAFRSISDSSSASINIQLADGLIYMQASLNGSMANAEDLLMKPMKGTASWNSAMGRQFVDGAT
jgi:hypothetical protein